MHTVIQSIIEISLVTLLLAVKRFLLLMVDLADLYVVSAILTQVLSTGFTHNAFLRAKRA